MRVRGGTDLFGHKREAFGGSLAERGEGTKRGRARLAAGAGRGCVGGHGEGEAAERVRRAPPKDTLFRAKCQPARVMW